MAVTERPAVVRGLVASNDWIEQDPARVAAFLKSLDMAADYTATDPPSHGLSSRGG